TYTPAQTVTLGDETYQVMSACKPHDCGSQRIAVMWSEKSNQMAVLREYRDKFPAWRDADEFRLR
ncbi:Ivy family c-type lysozyme inhibitor, partial [Escherichia coli]|uniref:Ivy family c-type lysozyme inhibitor n=1 Tax=Escherichia coli TaxID=562 RepID=UPI003D9BEBD7